VKITALHIDITNRCNLNCEYCFVTRRRKGLAHGNIKKFVKLIKGALEYGVKRISISGGEPLQHPGILELIRACSGGHVILFSNLYGDQVNDQLISDILTTGQVQEIKVSLDGLVSHEKARPPSKAKDVIKKIELVKKVAPQCHVTINTILTKYNLPELRSFQETLVQMGINHWRLDLPMKSPSTSVYASFREVITTVADIIKDRYENGHLQRMELTAFRVYKSSLENLAADNMDDPGFDNAHPCAYAIGKMAVGVDGKVSICSPLQLEIARAWEYDDFLQLVNVYSTHPFFLLRQGELGNCKRCRYYRLCGTGCRGEALEWMGKCDAIDPLSCSVMPLVEEKIVPILSSRLRTIYKSLINEEGLDPEFVFPSQREMEESFTKSRKEV